MGTGIVFVYLSIAALAAPLVWLFWWGAGTLGERRSRPAAAPHGDAQRHVFSYPEAVDRTLPSRLDAVTIYSRAGREIGVCAGPDAKGACPRPGEDGVVPCSGCLLALPRPVRGSFEWQIPSAYKACPIGSYAVFLQPG